MRIALIAPVFNEEAKIDKVLQRVPREIVDKIFVIDDGSTDSSVQVALDNGGTVIPLGRTVGVGAAIRAGYHRAARDGFDVAVVIAGNNKDAPEEIATLLEPIANDRADFVQGSRFLHKSRNFGSMPLYRRAATRIHPVLFSIVAGKRVTESTNGFRAVRLSLLADPRLKLDQEWLNEYELEPYLYLRVIKLGYRTTEVPVTKIYPPKSMGQTKMRPIKGWWSILRPLVRAGFQKARREEP